MEINGARGVHSPALELHCQQAIDGLRSQTPSIPRDTQSSYKEACNALDAITSQRASALRNNPLMDPEMPPP